MKQATKNSFNLSPMKKGSEQTQPNRLGVASFDEVEHPPHVAPDAHVDEEVTTHGTAVDDALGLYLKQMGSIPLLSRDRELALAIRLEDARRRYRHAVL